MADADVPQSPLSVGITWAYRCVAMGMEFALPTLAGVALDRRWGWTPGLTILGAILGFALLMFDLLRIARQGTGPAQPPSDHASEGGAPRPFL